MVLNIFIFLAGILIYAGYGLWGLVWLLAATGISYILGRLIPRHKWLMWVGVGLQALLLVALKLQPITGTALLAPMGVSYFSLQIISYLADIYRGKILPESNPLRYGLYVTYLPHLFVGPIESYPTMQAALSRRRITWDGISLGFARVLWGLFKKLVIAARAGVIISAISAESDTLQGGYALLAMLMYSLQLYADFSGGIDAVLGVSRMLGLSLSENFDRPYFSESVQEFWKRWHITLGAWLRNYVYIPLGGNRKGNFRKGLNTVITFLVSGLWHGVHYLLWGLFNGLFVIVGKRLQTPWKWFNRLGTFLAISFLWCFFIWPDTLTALKSFASVFTVFNYPALISGVGTLGLSLADWLVMAGSSIVLWLYDWKRENVSSLLHRLSPAIRVAILCGLALLVLVLGRYGIGFQAEDFIYSRF
ncbi:MAG: MBOAT family protein [Oscillospiraceae bacterium]|nr:MBOAT family protein [Oscillospiraceae bacterium]